MLNAVNRLRITRKAIKDAIKYKRTPEGTPPYLIKKVPNLRIKGLKLYTGPLELVPAEERAKQLRLFVYGKGSVTPHGRDSLYHAIKEKKLAGVPRRFVADYLRQQPIVSSTASKPRRVVRQNTASVRSQSFFACDLVHIRVRDVPDNYLGEADDAGKVPQSEVADRYFLTVVNLLTSFVWIRFTKRKLATHVAAQMKSIIADIQKRFPKGITVMASDDGKEFRGDVGTLFKKHKIKHRIQHLSPHVESRNAYIQQIFYRLVRMKRGALKSVMNQTQNIANSTVHRQLGITPNAALKLLQEGKPVKRVDYKPQTKRPNKPPTHAFKVGDVVRKVKHAREKEVKLGYKRYRGEQFTKRTFVIKSKRLVKTYPRYTLDDGSLAWHDELIKARADDVVDLPVSAPKKPVAKKPGPVVKKKPAKKKKKKPPPLPTRRSTRQRGKRVDYSSYF